MSLLPKKEYVLYAPLSVRQREALSCLDGGLRKWLIHGGTGGVKVVDDDEAIEELHEVEAEFHVTYLLDNLWQALVERTRAN